MAVLVTGASGFLGGRLAQVLCARGDRVRILARAVSDLRHLAGLSVEVVSGGLADTEVLSRAVRGVTHIYHCAGCATDWAPWRVFYDANVLGVRNLLRAALQSDALVRFLHVSTSDVYGYPIQPCGESQPVKDAGLSYNRTKIMGEECVWAASRDRGLPVTILRPATIYGPRCQVFGTQIARHIQRGSMALIDGGRAPGGFCYVDHVVDAMILAAASPEAVGRAYNLADRTGVTWREYVNVLADGLGARRPWISIPSAVAMPMARALEAAHGLLPVPGRPLLTRHAVCLFSRNQEYPAERARNDFGFSPVVPFDEACRRTLAWLKPELK